MVDIAAHKREIRRAKEILRTTESPKLKRDMEKHLKRMERELLTAIHFLKEADHAKGNEPEQPCES